VLDPASSKEFGIDERESAAAVRLVASRGRVRRARGCQDDCVRRVVALAVVAASIAVACTSTDGRRPPTAPGPFGRISGHLLLLGGPSNVHRPVPGWVTFIDARGARIDEQVGPDGAFTAGLQVGTYSVSGSSPADQVNVADNNCHARHPTVAVVADRTARVNVFCAMN
jgi:hypothetical protein